eukprot:gene3398-5943_t
MQKRSGAFLLFIFFVLIECISSEITYQQFQQSLDIISFHKNLHSKLDETIWKKETVKYSNNNQTEILLCETLDGVGYLNFLYLNKNWEEVIQNLEVKPIKLKNEIKVHSGIYDLMNSFNWTEIKKKIKNLKEIFLIGHSIGGAISILSTLKLSKYKFKSLTFAAPLVVDQNFQNYFANISTSFFSLYAEKDIIPGTLTGELMLKLHKNTKIEIDEISNQILKKSHPFLSMATNPANYQKFLSTVVSDFKQKISDKTIKNYEPFGFVYLVKSKSTKLFFKEYSNFKFHLLPPSGLDLNIIFTKEYLKLHSFKFYHNYIIEKKKSFLIDGQKLKMKVLNKPKILVVGGLGYIGLHTILKLKRTYKVFVLDDGSSGINNSIRNEKSIIFIRKSIKDLKFISNLIETSKIELVMFLIGSSNVQGKDDLISNYENNVFSIIRLIKKIKNSNLKKMVFASTSEIYESSNELISEKSSLKSDLNSFLETKLIIERFLKLARKSYGIESVILRYSKVCGSNFQKKIGQFHKNQNDLIESILKNENEIILKKNVIRDYIHVDDVANANLKAINYLFNGGKFDIFNIGSSGKHQYSDLQILRLFEKLLDKKIDFKYSKSKETKIIPDSNHAKKVLNFEIEEINFENILKSSIEYYKQYPKGYEIEQVGDLNKVKLLMEQLGY